MYDIDLKYRIISTKSFSKVTYNISYSSESNPIKKN